MCVWSSQVNIGFPFTIFQGQPAILLLHTPKYLKAIKGKKTDKKGAKWIADIFKHDLVSGSFIPPADIRQFRDLVRYRCKLNNFNVGEKNRAQNCLTVSNIKLDNVFSDVFGKASTNIVNRLLENPTEKITDVSGSRTKAMKATNVLPLLTEKSVPNKPKNFGLSVFT